MRSGREINILLSIRHRKLRSLELSLFVLFDPISIYKFFCLG